MSKSIHGMHEKCPLDVMPDGTVLYIAEVGDSTVTHSGIDLSDEPRTIIIRIQWLFGEHGGCYPPLSLQAGFIQRVESMVRNTPDCHVFVAGNEPNIETEGLFEPGYAAEMYKSIRVAILEQPGHEDDLVLLPPIGPWNTEIGYGWIEYFTRLIALCPDIDGFALHSYARGSEPSNITAQDKMGAPYEQYYSNFQAYRDWMNAIPKQYRDRPAYITEFDENDAWENRNTRIIQAAYAEIDKWNKTPGNQQIRCLMLYRWPHHDKYFIEGKANVIIDFIFAQDHGYEWEDTPMAEWTATYTNHCNDYHEWGEHPPITVLDGWAVDWDRSMPRPEMTFKLDPQDEVYKLDPPRSGVGFHVSTKFDWWLRTEQPVNIAAGVRTKLRVPLMVVAHGISGDSGKLGDCGMTIGIDADNQTDVTYPGILWSPWDTVRDGEGGNLTEYEWITAETPEIIPTVGQVTLWIRCVANVAADISAGHFDLIQVLQMTDGPVIPPEPPTGTWRTVTYDPAGTAVGEFTFEGPSVNPQICAHAQAIAELTCS